MSVTDGALFAMATALTALIAYRLFYGSSHTTRDPSTPGWRVVTRQFGRERRTAAMPKARALDLASRLIYDAVVVIRLDNDADGTTISLAEIRAEMERATQGA